MAQFSSADTVLWGQYVQFGDEIRIDATLEDTTTGRTVALKEQASRRDRPYRCDWTTRHVGSREPRVCRSNAVKGSAAAAFKPSSKSVQALRYYSEGLELEPSGKHLDAVKKFEASVEEDGQFALAYSKLAESYAALGQPNEAERPIPARR